jgi:hypothetical protein
MAICVFLRELRQQPAVDGCWLCFRNSAASMLVSDFMKLCARHRSYYVILVLAILCSANVGTILMGYHCASSRLGCSLVLHASSRCPAGS